MFEQHTIVSKKIVNYYLGIASCNEELSQNVKNLISKGWSLYGNPYCSEGEYHCQAMVKYED